MAAGYNQNARVIPAGVSPDASASLPAGLTVATPNANLQSFPVLVDQLHARARTTHQVRRDQMHRAGLSQDLGNQAVADLPPSEKPTL